MANHGLKPINANKKTSGQLNAPAALLPWKTPTVPTVENTNGTNCKGSCVGPSVSLKSLENRRTSCLIGNRAATPRS